MKIVIDIPEEFIGDWERDRFVDSLLRLAVGADHEGLDLCGMLISVFEEAKEVYEWG